MDLGSYVRVRQLWRTVAILVAVAVFYDPSARPAVQALYGVVVLVALLWPLRAVSRTAILRLLGVALVGAGSWFAVTTDVDGWLLLAFYGLGALALALPEVVRDDWTIRWPLVRSD